MQIIELSKQIDAAFQSMDTETYSVVNNVQGGYLTVDAALKKVAAEHHDIVRLAGELWSLIDSLDEVETEIFNQWLDDEIDDETLTSFLS